MAGFGRCDSGNVMTMFALFLLPVLGAAGVAIDYGRAIAAKTSLQAAVDSAVLSSRQGGLTEESAIKARAEAFFAANSNKLYGASVVDVDVKVVDNVIEMKVKAAMPTSIAALLGKDDLELNVRSKAAAAAEDVEIALVLDNTGSMRDFMGDLKQGAKDLVEAVHKSATSKSKLKFAVVPYVGVVNIGNQPQHMAWMDTAGDSSRHAIGLRWRSFGYEPGCYTGGVGGGSGPGSGTTGSLFDLMPKFADAAKWILGISSAHAASASDVPSPFIFYDPCWIANPGTVNVFDLFDQIPNAQWKGCVLARPEPYDADDTPPSDADANTKFVPWFWPDQSDNARLTAQSYGFQSTNDYLPDRENLTPAKFQDPWIGWSHFSIQKYNGTAATIDETGPDTLGPNKSCPDPIVPLTNAKGDIINAIDKMVHWNGSGTNVAEGLAWGWRVLSPEEPFTEGAPYGQIRKVIVLMTDGVNNIDPSPDDALYSDYSAYGHLNDGVINPPTYDQFKAYADSRLVQVCQNVKAKGITIYTVAFGVVDGPTLAKLEACASKPPYAYAPGTTTELVEAFNSIGSSLTELRLME